MTREEFKDAVLNILLNQKFGNFGVLFDTEDIRRYKIAQYGVKSAVMNLM